MKTKLLLLGALLAWQCASAQAQIPITASASAPATGADDQYYLPDAVDEATGAMNASGNGTNADSGANDGLTYVAADRTSKGQSFTTGPNANGYTLSSVTVRHILMSSFLDNGTYANVPNGATFAFRFGTLSGSALTPTLTTTATYSGTAISSGGDQGSGNYLTFDLSGAGIGTLLPNTTYFFELASASPHIELHNTRTNATSYTGGTAFRGDNNAALDADGVVSLSPGEFAFVAKLIPFGGPSVVATVNPSSGKAGQSFTITATVTPSVGTVTNVSVNLSAVGGSASASLVLSNANVWTNTFTVPSGALAGTANLTVSAKDTASLTGYCGVPFTVLFSLVAVPFDLTNVTLLPSPFQTNMLLDKAYLLSLNSDRLLYSFRANAGLSTSNASPYGGWENPGDTLCLGHSVGHYLSACSMMYASTGDPALKAQTDYLVGELAKCQAASPAAGFNTGYLSAFPESYIDALINETQGSFSVPWYALHKVMAGLLDTYQHAGNNQALTVLTNMANWVQYRMDQLTASQIQSMLNYREYGGMNEVLANLSAVTGNPNYLRIAADFDKQSLFNPLSLDQDTLDGMHANTQIPEIIGAAREYELTSTGSYHEIASFFWNRVANYRSYVIGGNSDGEHFFPITDFPSHVDAQTCETCNTYNMLKLTRHLFGWSPSAATMDFYERALYNQILGSEAAPGSVTYFVSLQPGHFKTYSTPENSFWCCDGTGMENHSKYGDTIYFHDTNSLYLNLFIASQLNWPEKNLTVVQNTTFPQSDTTTLTFRCTNGLPLTLNIRYPSWAQSGMQLAINGVSQTVTNSPGSYVSVTRNWQTNDQVQIRFPMTLRTEALQDTANTVALFYGPILLAGTLGTNGMPASDLAVNQWDFFGVSIPAGTVPMIVADIPTLLSNTVPVPGQPLTFQTVGLGRPNDVTLIPFYQLQHQRYSVYWSLMGPSATCVWSGGGTPANWSVGANWNLTPTNQCAVQFGLAAGGNTTNDLAASTQINGIQFIAGAGNFVLNGNGIALQGDVVNHSSSAQQINLPIQLTGGIEWNFNTAAGDLTLGGAVSGSGSINKQGAHTLTVTSNLSFNGAVEVAAGQLQIGNGGASDSLGSLAVAVDAGASLAFNRGDTFQVGNAISGAGSVIKRGAGTMQLSGVLSNTGPTIIEAGTLQIASQPVPVLKHRWSFNGNLTDSVGASNAVVVSVGANQTTLTTSNITLTGGSQSASDYVALGSGLLPKDGSPATIELWATQMGAQNWARIFDAGSSTSDNLFMSWSQGTDTTKDRVEWQDSVTTTTDNSVAPYTLGSEYHIAMVMQPGAGSGGNTRATWYVAPVTNSSFGTARGTFDTANTLANLNDVNFWLGRSEYGDNTAYASYGEVRLWNRAFSQSELQQLHALGPNSVGPFATNNSTGSLAALSDLALLSGATLDLGGTTQQVASVTAASGSVIQLNGGQLKIGTGTNTATFAGSFSGSGSIQVNGTLRLVGNASIASGILLTNNGTLDIMSWTGALSANFVNHGTVLDRSLVKLGQCQLSNTDFKVSIFGYAGHGYQLQYRDSLVTGTWQSIGSAVAGGDAPILLVHPGGIGSAQRFYHVLVSP